MATIAEKLVTHRSRVEAQARCLVCGGGELTLFLDLGRMALANRYVHPASTEAEARYPLRAAFCEDCAHVQLVDRVAPEEMYEEYLYISSCSTTLVDHLESLATAICDRAPLTGTDLVVDIGSNDGTLLAAIGGRGARVLGIDPAKNLAKMARAKGVPTETAYFGEETARRVAERHGRARVITATNSFPHIPALDDYLRGVESLLAPDGHFVIEAHYVADLVEQAAFDTIYHEHVSYWALGPLATLFGRHGFEIVDAERLPVHHGQIRVWARRIGCEAPSARAEELLRMEAELGLRRVETFHRFAQSARTVCKDLHAVLARLQCEGRRVAGYGAPAKASTLAGAAGLSGDLVAMIADRSPLKQGRLLPGTKIPIVGPEQMLAMRPDYVLLLAWNFADEIMSQLGDFRERGGKFILPVPEVRIV